MMGYHELRASAIEKIARFWELDSPKCMAPFGCIENFPLEINHIYGDGNEDRKKMNMYQFYKAIVLEQYEVRKLNLLCSWHNREANWFPFKVTLLLSGKPYQPGKDFFMPLFLDEYFRRVFEFGSDDKAYGKDLERQIRVVLSMQASGMASATPATDL